ncbi:hypothetical protein PR048_026668 [Dryococelus australis]|uniref:Uncharacterized protein n=1 Tax=Dryococelus australis TaxID=614101 RepID=A0ABQ9GM19_9NEOP|nr:hypothetical protein PR048_026668 [Dryococelus australis]
MLAMWNVGRKLGPSTGLVADHRGVLLYFLPRDHAVVRWDIRQGTLSPKNHTVLLQSPGLLPAVNDLSLSPRWDVWAAAGQRCIQVQKRVSPPPLTSA